MSYRLTLLFILNIMVVYLWIARSSYPGPWEWRAVLIGAVALVVMFGPVFFFLLLRPLRFLMAERNSVAARVQASQETFRQLAANMREVFWMTSPNGQEFLYISPGYESLWGRTCASLDQQPLSWFEAILPEDQPQVRVALDQLSHDRECNVKCRIRRPDGTIRWICARWAPVHDAAGKMTSTVGFATDITEQKRVEEDLTFLNWAVEQAAESIVVTDREANIVYVNPAFERTTGYRREEVVGKNPRLLQSGKQDADFYRAMWDVLTRGEVWTGNFTNKRKDGTLYEEQAIISAVRDATGAIVNFVAAKRDVTYERQIEQQLRQAQKMEAIGRLAGGVAHDFNNILSVIGGYSELLLRRLAADDPLRQNAEQIEKAAYRASALTRQLLAFSRKQILQPKILNLNTLLTESEKMLRRLIGEDVALVTDLSPELGAVKVDAGQVEQVVMNLVVNARDAMPGGGRLSIQTRNVSLDAAYAREHSGVVAGPYILLAISDSGTGMSAEVKAHLFEPFFTTKPQGKGTGLGLATCFGIIKQSGGHISVYSEAGHGTLFQIYLPRVNAPATTCWLATEGAGPPRGTETILLVEDEPALRCLAAVVLTEQGYSVVEAANGQEALAILQKGRRTPVDLVMTDVVMPQMGGRELADQIQRLYPGMQMLLTSGYTEDAMLHHRVLESHLTFLQKPYTPVALARKVREVLDRPTRFANSDTGIRNIYPSSST